MAEDNMEKNESVTPAEQGEKEQAPVEPNPVKEALERVQKKGEGRTELEKARFTRQQIDKRIAELESDEGATPLEDEDDSKPVTIGDLKKLEREQSKKTALNLADEIEDEAERELAKHYLTNTIRPSGNPKEDLRVARQLVNAEKNKQLIEQAQKKNSAPSMSNSSGAPANFEESFEPTPEELVYMRPPFNLKKEQIIASRKAQK